eukprot:SAG11_NODE_13321_length_660_cov_1.046346_1_plen_81_part_00
MSPLIQDRRRVSKQFILLVDHVRSVDAFYGFRVEALREQDAEDKGESKDDAAPHIRGCDPGKALLRQTGVSRANRPRLTP